MTLNKNFGQAQFILSYSKWKTMGWFGTSNVDM